MITIQLKWKFYDLSGFDLKQVNNYHLPISYSYLGIVL